MLRTLPVAALLALASAASLAQAQTGGLLYQTNFEDGFLDWHWTGNSHLQLDGTTFSTFNGYQSGTAIDFLQHEAVTASPLPPGSWARYTLTFDFYAFDSWQGTAGGDRFLISCNGATIFNESFSNNGAQPQSFRAPDRLGVLGGRTSYTDSIYRNIALTFDLPNSAADANMRFRFYDSGSLGGLNTASWGLDYVRLSWTTVPAPATLGALGLGLMLSGRRKR